MPNLETARAEFKAASLPEGREGAEQWKAMSDRERTLHNFRVHAAYYKLAAARKANG